MSTGKYIEIDERLSKGKEDENSIKREHLSWKKVSCGVPNGLVLASVMFPVFINGVNDEIMKNVPPPQKKKKK